MRFVVSAVLPLLLVVASVVGARAESKSSRVFDCSLGGKRVSVTKSGDRFTYHFGTAAKDDMSITGDHSAANIFQMEQRFTGPESQLRFTNGEFSYIVYSAEANANVGARSTAGLVVMRGTKVISHKLCSRFTEMHTFDNGFLSLPEDTETYSAM